MRRVTASTEITANSRQGLLILRHPSWADYEAWSDLRRNSAGFLRPWEPEWTEAHLTRGSYRLRLGRLKKMLAADQAYPFHVFRADTGQMVGSCNLTHIERGAAQSAKIGYWVGEPFINRGFGLGAVNGICRFGFETLGLHRIEAAVKPDNGASIRLLGKARFTHEGQARGYLKINGEWADHAIFARLSSD